MRPLTETEFRLMCHLAAGKTREEVAARLGVSKSTLYDRCTAIRIKFNAQTFDQALQAFGRIYGEIGR